MIKEIYCKDPSDSFFQENIIEHSDVYETVLSKIRMILYTKNGELLGDPNFGVNLDEYIFSLNASNETIERKIREQISTYIPEALYMSIDVFVNFNRGETHDVCFIDISINGTKSMKLIIT